MRGLIAESTGRDCFPGGVIQLPFSDTLPREDESPSPRNGFFQSGRRCFKRGDFTNCIPLLQKAKNGFLQEMNFKSYFDCYDMLFHALYEQCKTGELEIMRLELEAVCNKYDIEKDPRTLALMLFYIMDLGKRNNIPAVLKKILRGACQREAESRRKNHRLKEFSARLDIIYCLYAYTAYYCQTRRVKNFQEELKSLRALLEDYDQLKERVKEEKSRTDNLKDQKVLRDLLYALGKSDSFVKKIGIHIKYMETVTETNPRKKERLLWETLEVAGDFRSDHLLSCIYLNMSRNYMELNNPDQSAAFLKLSEKHADFNNFKRLARKIRQIKKRLEDLRNQNQFQNYDLILDRKRRSIVEKKKGLVSFKNQFVLWDILDLLASRPGEAFSKQKLAERIWKQDYTPLTHDNKIYVTFKRLRKRVEQNSRQPVYICRNRSGYHLNEGMKILIK